MGYLRVDTVRVAQLPQSLQSSLRFVMRCKKLLKTLNVSVIVISCGVVFDVA